MPETRGSMEDVGTAFSILGFVFPKTKIVQTIKTILIGIFATCPHKPEALDWPVQSIRTS